MFVNRTYFPAFWEIVGLFYFILTTVFVETNDAHILSEQHQRALRPKMNLIYIPTKWLQLLVLTNVALSLTQTNLYVAVNNTATFTLNIDNNTACYKKQFVKGVTNILTIGHNINNQSANSSTLNRVSITDTEDRSTCTVQICNVSTIDQGPYKFEPDKIKFYLWVVRFDMVPAAITEGVDVNVTCVVENNNIDVYWIHDSLEINYSQSLVLPNVSRDDSGIYTCCIKDSVKTHRINTTITVQYPPDVAIHFIDDNLTCTATGSPSEMKFIYLKHWSFFGEYIRKIHQNSTQMLPLNTFHDSGKYICTASNGIEDMTGHMNISVYKTITIQGLPFFLPDNRKVYYGNLGQSQLIVVNVYCHPKCENISWITENSSSSQISETFHIKEIATNMTTLFHRAKVTVEVKRIVLTIQKLQERDFKQYTVIAVNTNGKSYFKFSLLKTKTQTAVIPVVVWYIISCVCGTTLICICRFIYICCLKAKTRETRKTPSRNNVQMKSELAVVELVSNQSQSVGGRRFVIRDLDQQLL